ncbi:MAG: hypothetical protein Q9207_007900 [Kuettlingeria erythrocarpa]
MEVEMAQRDRDIAEAQTIIQYLLKLNASSHQASMACCRSDSQIQNKSAASSMGVEIKDLLGNIINILHSKLSTIKINHGHFSSSNKGASVSCEDLLDISDKAVSPDTVHPEGTIPLEPLKSKITEASHNLQSKQSTLDSAADDGLGHSFTACQEIHAQASDDFPSQPYVNRFTPAGYQNASCKRAEIPRSNGSGGLESSQTPGSASSSDLSGSTQCDWLGPTTFDSLSSSLNNSEDEASEDIQHGRKGQKREVQNVQERHQKQSEPSSWASSSDGASVASASDIAETVVYKIAQKDTSDPGTNTLVLFMPRWPTKTFALSGTEREGTILIHKRVAGDREYRFPDFFRYGIRFRPEPTERNIYRTVLVDNLPPSLRLFELLNRVKGGLVLDAKLLNTVCINGRLSAMITFFHECGAKAFLSGARSQPLLFDATQARVTLLPTPTYPISKMLRTAIEEHHHTRCLEIQNFPKGIKPAELERDLRVCEAMTTHRIEAKRMRLDGVLELRFNSINYAGGAYGILTSRDRYRRCIVKFAPDQCAQPWEEIPEEHVTVCKQHTRMNNESGLEMGMASQPKEAKPDEEDVTAPERDRRAPHEQPIEAKDRTGRLTPVQFREVTRILRCHHPDLDTAAGRGSPHTACRQQ